MKQILQIELLKKCKNSKTWITLIVGVALSFCFLWICMFQKDIFLRKVSNECYIKSSQLRNSTNLAIEMNSIEDKESEEYKALQEEYDRKVMLQNSYGTKAAYLYSNLDIEKNSVALTEAELVIAEIENDQKTAIKMQYLLDYQLTYEFENSSTKTILFMKNYFVHAFPWIILIISLLLAIESIGDDYENGTFKLLLTQPISKSKLISAKLFINMAIALIISIIVSIIMICYTNVTYGFGHIDYPLIYEGSHSTYLTIKSVLPYFIMIALSQFVFITLAANFIVIVAKKIISSIVIGVSLFGFGYLICKYIPLLDLIIPNNYTSIVSLMNVNQYLVIYYVILCFIGCYFLYQKQINYFNKVDII